MKRLDWLLNRPDGARPWRILDALVVIALVGLISLVGLLTAFNSLQEQRVLETKAGLGAGDCAPYPCFMSPRP